MTTESHVLQNREWVRYIKMNRNCDLCGMPSSPGRLAWRYGLGEIPAVEIDEGGAGRQALEAEMAKCDLICGACK